MIGGIGLGLAYVVPVAVLVKWFPDRRGLMTGLAVGGFGAGALITAPVATELIQRVGVLNTFACLGIAYLIITVCAASFIQNPPQGWAPLSWRPNASQLAQRAQPTIAASFNTVFQLRPVPGLPRCFSISLVVNLDWPTPAG